MFALVNENLFSVITEKFVMQFFTFNTQNFVFLDVVGGIR